MTDTLTDTAVLTAGDVTALRTADSVTFHRFKGKAYIRAYLASSSGGDARIWTAREQRVFSTGESAMGARYREITCTDTVFGYPLDGDAGPKWRGTDATECFEMIHSAQFTRLWPTIARLLRVGDVPVLAWTADNNNGTVREAGLHLDELAVRVPRKGGDLVLHVGYRCTPNNGARMIRQHG